MPLIKVVPLNPSADNLHLDFKEDLEFERQTHNARTQRTLTALPCWPEMRNKEHSCWNKAQKELLYPYTEGKDAHPAVSLPEWNDF
ncbi:unnamed protein product [Caretta caretta]